MRGFLGASTRPAPASPIHQICHLLHRKDLWVIFCSTENRDKTDNNVLHMKKNFVMCGKSACQLPCGAILLHVTKFAPQKMSAVCATNMMYGISQPSISIRHPLVTDLTDYGRSLLPLLPIPIAIIADHDVDANDSV